MSPYLMPLWLKRDSFGINPVQPFGVKICACFLSVRKSTFWTLIQMMIQLKSFNRLSEWS